MSIENFSAIKRIRFWLVACGCCPVCRRHWRWLYAPQGRWTPAATWHTWRCRRCEDCWRRAAGEGETGV